MQVVIRRRNPYRNMARFYFVGLQYRLPLDGSTDSTLPPCDVVREWGSIGSEGKVLIVHYSDECIAAAAAETWAKRKQRRGYV